MRQNVHKPQRVIVRISSMDFVPSIINSLFTAFNIGIICVEQHDFATKFPSTVTAVILLQIDH